MLYGKRTPPIYINDNGDVELFMVVLVDCNELTICVTVGGYEVERYQFQRRVDLMVMVICMCLTM